MTRINISLVLLMLQSLQSSFVLASTCENFVWDGVKELADDQLEFKVSRSCAELIPLQELDQMNEKLLNDTRNKATEIFTEDVQRVGYQFSSKERLVTKNGELFLKSRNFAHIDLDHALFASEALVLKGEGRAKFSKAISTYIDSNWRGRRLMIKITTKLRLKKPQFIPQKMFVKTVKNDTQEDLVTYSKVIKGILSQE